MTALSYLLNFQSMAGVNHNNTLITFNNKCIIANVKTQCLNNFWNNNAIKFWNDWWTYSTKIKAKRRKKRKKKQGKPSPIPSKKKNKTTCQLQDIFIKWNAVKFLRIESKHWNWSDEHKQIQVRSSNVTKDRLNEIMSRWHLLIHKHRSLVLWPYVTRFSPLHSLHSSMNQYLVIT